MTFVPSSSRRVSTSPKTPAHVRATLAKMLQSTVEDQTSLAVLTELIETLLAAASRDAEADETILQGECIRVLSTGNIVKAQADSLSNSGVDGVALEDIASGTVGKYAPLGIVTKDGWGLTPGAEYFLSAVTAGAIGTAPDSTSAGAVIIIVGRALSTDELLVNIDQRLLL